MGKSALVAVIFAFERQHDRHRSLRKKYNVYKTGTIKAIDVKRITIFDDNTCLFEDEKYLI
jgi:hypothetical protein